MATDQVELRLVSIAKAIEQLVNERVAEAGCPTCAQIHPFHASNPFDALSAEAP